MNPIKVLDRPIAFHRFLVEPCGSITAALMLSQAIYWTNRTAQERNGWFWKTAEEWQEETGLTRREQENARALLKSRNLLEEKLVGVPARLHYRVVQTSLALLSKLDSTEPPNKIQQNRQTTLSTKTTTENTPTKGGGEPGVETLRGRISRLFNLPETYLWGCEEEHYLVDVFKRRNWMIELEAIEDFFIHGTYLPQSIKSLMQAWNQVYERSINYKDNRKRNEPQKEKPKMSLADKELLDECKRAERACAND